ncbi:hypothetical protein PROFUN_10069 [Planoprotostelium fungivorum]|uniref:Ras guanine nucleotide exchange factor n=1 Tax=Planoprotostelium fungivorum TaxID=1890364 RepID=A0A2P6NEW6_9EUKA|nr:hypothetical protein PROFUN_10069 [Planoprotostelium fungivorum]
MGVGASAEANEGHSVRYRNGRIQSKEAASWVQKLAADRQISVVDIVNCKMKKIPQSVSNGLNHLRILSLPSNGIKDIPEMLGSLPALEELDLSHNEITSIPSSLLHMKTLKSLMLSDNKIIGVSHKGESQSCYVKRLLLNQNPLKVIPDIVCAMTQLEELHVSECDIAEVADLSRMKQLRTLRLSRNRMTAFPLAILSLSNLQILGITSTDLSYNALTVVPSQISELKELRDLNISHNNLLLFPDPDALGLLSHLRDLRLEFNSIEELPSSIDRLCNLRRLYLHNNRIQEIPSEVGSIHSLRALCLDCNKIKSVSSELHKLEKLHTLRLHNNELMQLPEALTDDQFVRQLVLLSLDNNPIDPRLIRQIKLRGAISAVINREKNDLKPTRINSRDTFKVRTRTSSKVQLTQSMGTMREMIQKEITSVDEEIPPINRFKDMWDNIMAEEGITLSNTELTNMSVEQRWNFVCQYRSWPHLQMIRSDPAKKNIGVVPYGTEFRFKESTSAPSSPSKKGTITRRDSWRGSKVAKMKLTVPEVSGTIESIYKSKKAAELKNVQESMTIFQPWAASFIEAGGMKCILDILFEYQREGNTSDDDCIVEAIAVLDMITTLDLPGVLHRMDWITSLLDLMDHTHSQIQSQVLQLLAKLGVMEALEVKYGTHLFKRILAPFFTENTTEVTPKLKSIKSYSLLFINAMVINQEDIVYRNSLRNDFLRAGLDQILKNAKLSNEIDLQNEVELFENELLEDYNELLVQLQERGNDPALLSLLQQLTEVKAFTFQHSQEMMEKIDKDMIKDILQIELIPIPFNSKTTAGHVCNHLALHFNIERPEDYAIYVPSITKDSTTTDDLSSSLSDSINLDTAETKSVIDSMTEGTSDGPGTPRSERASSHLGSYSGIWLLQPDKLLYDYQIQGRAFCEYKEKMWSVKIESNVNGITSVFSILMDPNATVTHALKMVGKRVRDNMEDYCLFVNNKKEQGAKETEQLQELEGGGRYFGRQGVWLSEWNKLNDYTQLIRNNNQLKLRKKPVAINIRQNSRTMPETTHFDDDATVLTIKHFMLQTYVNSSSYMGRPIDYAIFLETGESEGEEGRKFVEDTTMVSEIPQRMSVGMHLRPREMTVILPAAKGQVTDGSTSRARAVVDITLDVEQLLEELCQQFDLSSSDHILLLADESKQGIPKQLDPNKSLQNQCLPDEASLVLSFINEEVEDNQQTEEVNIWNEPSENIVYENGKVISASLNKFVEVLTAPDSYNTSFLDTFLLTYESFTTAEMLFTKLKERFRVPEGQGAKTKSTIQLRVCVFISHWIKKHFQSLLVSHISLLKGKSDTRHQAESSDMWTFIDEEMIAEKDNLSMTAMATGLKKTIGDSMNIQETVTVNPPPPNMRILSSMTFYSIDEMDVAKYLTLQASAIFIRLKPVELYNQKWNSEKTKHLSPNVVQLIDMFNHISRAVASIIVSEEKLRKRTKLMQILMKISRNLSTLRNYHVSMAFISGMSNAAITRLKWTKEKISRGAKQMFDAAEQEVTRKSYNQTDLQQMSLSGSYRNYRQAINTTDQPCIPYLGVHLQDLLFIEEGNPDTLNGLINWRKRDYIADVVKQFQRLQSNTHTFPELEHHVEFKRFILGLPQLNDKEMFDASLKREPRNIQRSSELE